VDRIFLMAENDQKYFHTYQLREQKNKFLITILGQVFGYTLGLGGIYAGFTLSMGNKSLAGVTLFLGAVATLIGTAIWAKSPPKQDK
jgi:uncharacterized membrane protein